MDTIIFRKSDKLIAGKVFPRRTEAQTQEAILVEISNILQSELGGIASDYATVESARAPRGFQVIVNPDDTTSIIAVVLSADRIRIAELLAIPRANWTTPELRELLFLIVKER